MAWLCLSCRVEAEPRDGLNACPSCGARGVPADTNDRVTFSLTFHELRVLVIWAEFWASHDHGPDTDGKNMRRVLHGIADNIGAQVGRSITFASEVADLRKEFGSVEQSVIVEDPERRPQ